jgi:ArsR family transcriptional regulator
LTYSPDDRLFAARLKALAHPARLTILRSLLGCGGACCCGQIVDNLPLAQSTVSEHLRVLCAAGLIEATPSGTRCCYRPVPEAIADVVAELAALNLALEPGRAPHA